MTRHRFSTTFQAADTILRQRARTPVTERRVLTRDEAITLARTVLGMLSQSTDGVELDHRILALTTITQNTRVRCVTTDHLTVSFTTRIGSDQLVRVGTDVRDVESLREVVQRAELRATPPLRPADVEDDPDDPRHVARSPCSYLPVSLWVEATHRAMGLLQGDAVPRVIARMQASPFRCAGTLALMTRATLRLYQEGMLAWGEETDSEVSVTARTPDGKGSGWHGAAHRDWRKLDVEGIVQAAIDMAALNRGPVRGEPGRYTAILSSAAVGALVAQMGRFFGFNMLGPLAVPDAGQGIRTKVGQRILDSRLTLSTDPSDPECGEFPFFDDGYPSGKATWVAQGVLRTLAFDVARGMEYGVTPIKIPEAIRMTGGTTTLAEMIANCERGIYVNRFSGVDVVHAPSAAMSGTTRDGCFLIKNGKIATPVTNFRFYESPFFAFNKIRALGVPERVAFGFQAFNRDRAWGDATDGWPHPPVIVPPMMVEDFNFAAMSDAV